jgi:hypothetical protein
VEFSTQVREYNPAVRQLESLAVIGAMKLSGFPAWAAWLCIHIFIPDRLSEPIRCANYLGLGLPDLRARARLIVGRTSPP